MDQAVVPATGFPSASVQSKAAPPQTWTSIPRCCLYQACSAGASLALKKMPPMPVTRFMEPPMSGSGETCGDFLGLTLGLTEASHALPPQPIVGRLDPSTRPLLRLNRRFKVGIAGAKQPPLASRPPVRCILNL